MQAALDDQWTYAGELFAADNIDADLAERAIAPHPDTLKLAWDAFVADILGQATLNPPDNAFVHKGGKAGRHTEHLGHMLAQMQFLQRAYPDAVW